MARAHDDLNPTAASLLGFLRDGPLTGYELVRVAEMLIGDFWSLTRSQVYRELAALAARGLVEQGEIGPRARRPYRLTDAGRGAFARWVARPPGHEQIRYPLLLTMSFGSALGAPAVLAFVEQHRAEHERRLAEYEERWDTIEDPFVQAVLAFGMRYERAVLEWSDEVRTILAPAAPPR